MSLITNIAGGITTVVTPGSAAQMAVPFSFGPFGGVATTTDSYQQALAHLLSIAMTSPSERVMRPTYGVGLRGMVFENGNLLSFQTAAAALQAAFTTSESSVATVAVSVAQQAAGSYVFQVNFTVNQDPVLHQAVFDYAGQLVGSS